MPKKSAGILLYRFQNNVIEVLLVHPGGPFWAKKDLGIWSIPKGETAGAEDGLETAKRELQEETGIIATGPFVILKPVTQKAGKIISAWSMAFYEGLPELKSNTFEMEWPPRSGKNQLFPEIDKMAWFTIDMAMEKINIAQQSFLIQITELLII